MSPRDWCIGRTAIVRILVRAAAALALLALLGPAAARGDDRDLLRTTIADPYLFILLDTSGSMNWSPKGTTCPSGDCFVPLQADDASSKFYQAKEALYEVLTDPACPRWPGLRDLQPGPARRDPEAWLYEATGNGVLLTGSTYFPAAGAREVFGNGSPWACDTGNNDHEIGCYAASPADLNDAWELTRVRRLPKGGGPSPCPAQTFYIRTAGVTYKVTYTPNGRQRLRRRHQRQGRGPQVQQRRVLEHHVGRHADRRLHAGQRLRLLGQRGHHNPDRTNPTSATTPASPSTRSPTTPAPAGTQHRHRQRQERERLQPALADRQLGPAGPAVHPRRRHPPGLEDGPQGRHPEAAGAELRRRHDGPRLPHRHLFWRRPRRRRDVPAAQGRERARSSPPARRRSALPSSVPHLV